MSEDAEIRRQNFLKLWPKPFSPSRAAGALWGTPSLWRDLAHGQKSFGEKMARKIEEKLGLVRLSLDAPDGPKRQPLSAEVLAALAAASPEERLKIENMARIQLGLGVVADPVDLSGKRTAAAA